jgi:hypothetical protein
MGREEAPLNLKTIALAAIVAGSFLAAPPAGAQRTEPFAIGASVGLVNPVDNGFHLDSFDTRDRNLWLEYRAEDDIVVRGTFGTMRVNGFNAGKSVTSGGTAVVLPELRSRLNYVLCSVSYLVHESGWEAGLFAGVGGYRVDPDGVSDPAVAAFRDEGQTVWGFHAGLDADFQLWRQISVVTRVTFHNPQTHPNRQILTANAGLNYRF